MEDEKGGKAWETLPYELQVLTLSFLDLPTLYKCSTLNKLWHTLFENPSLWHMLYERDYGLSLVEVEGEVNDTTGKPTSAKDLYREASIKFEWSLAFSDTAFLPDRDGTRMSRDNNKSYYPRAIAASPIKARRGTPRKIKITFLLEGRGEVGLIFVHGEQEGTPKFLQKIFGDAGGDLSGLVTSVPDITHTICGKYHAGNALSWRATCEEPTKDGERRLKRLESTFDVEKDAYRWTLEIDCMRWVCTWHEDGLLLGETPLPSFPAYIMFCTPSGHGSCEVICNPKAQKLLQQQQM